MMWMKRKKLIFPTKPSGCLSRARLAQESSTARHRSTSTSKAPRWIFGKDSMSEAALSRLWEKATMSEVATCVGGGSFGSVASREKFSHIIWLCSHWYCILKLKLKIEKKIGDGGEDDDKVKISYYTACCNLRAWFSGLRWTFFSLSLPRRVRK